jgi:hypothetical protein
MTLTHPLREHQFTANLAEHHLATRLRRLARSASHPNNGSCWLGSGRLTYAALAAKWGAQEKEYESTRICEDQRSGSN